MDPSDLLMDMAATLASVPLNDMTDGELADLANRLAAAQQLERQIDVIIDALRLQLNDLLPADEIPIQGVGTLRRKIRSSSTWRHDNSGTALRNDIAIGIARMIGEDRFTGEVDQARRDAALDAIEKLWDVIYAPSNMKVAGARMLNLDIEDYRATTYTPTVIIEPEPT